MNRAIRFLQSPSDFPLTVFLGEKAPAWGLSRWVGAGLRFVPPDDEGFTLREDRRRLVYWGRKRSHRFTILGDTSFEYDCILEREPESNVITLIMEGTEYFDFFRQPDFIKDPFLKGSYAVYKKETLIGEGTGKLCHIHRPLIIDAMGKKVFGDLFVIGNELRITIPENWLSEAKYPVVVDPTIGTTAIGSLTTIYNAYMGVTHNLIFHYQIPVNRFLAPENIHGACTAHAYIHSTRTSTYDRPVMYSDDTGEPLEKLTGNEGVIDFKGTAGQPPGWRSADFFCNTPVEAGAYCWFGLFTEYWQTAYDYGGTLSAKVLGTGYYDLETIPEQYPQDNLASSLYGDMLSMLSELRLSMYFSYTVAQNHVRTLTQGVTLTDSRKQAANYLRKHLTALNISDTASRVRGFFRSVTEQLRTGDFISCCRDLLRTVAVTVKPETRGQRTLSARRGIADEAGTEDSTARQRGFIRTLLTAVSISDYAGKVITLLRGIREEVSALGEAGHLGEYLRGLYTEAGSMAETKHEGEYYRKVADMAGNTAVSLRHLFIFIRLATLSLVRDYLLPRFLRSRDGIVLKSPVTRELELDSRIH